MNKILFSFLLLTVSATCTISTNFLKIVTRSVSQLPKIAESVPSSELTQIRLQLARLENQLAQIETNQYQEAKSRRFSLGIIGGMILATGITLKSSNAR